MRSLSLLAAFLLSTVPIAAALAPAPSVGAPLAALEPPAAAHARALASTLLEASPGDAMRAIAAEAGHASARVAGADLDAARALEALGMPAAQREATLAELAALPALQAPVGRILAGMAHAKALRDAAFAGLSAEEQRFLAEHGAASLAPGGQGTLQQALDGPLLPAPARMAEDAATRAAVRALAERVDAGLLAEAGASLVDSLMASLEALQAAGAERAGGPTVDAPLINQAPYLLLNDIGNDVVSANYWLVIDLGGSDVYTNNAGAGSLASGIPVAALVDVMGDDRYTNTVAGTTASVNLVTQGAGNVGVGALVDAAGTDSYTATVALAPPPLTNPAPAASVVAQGAGVTGAGALVDLQGPNSYLANARTLGGAASTVAQGAGGFAGVGLNAGNADVGPNVSTTYAAGAVSDALLVAQSGNSRTYAIGSGSTVAQGGGSVGAGALADAAGNDRYTATSNGAAVSTIAQGGAGLGAGALADGEGADALVATATADATLDSVWPVTCSPGFTCGFTGTVTVTLGSALAIAQGAAEGGSGTLADLGIAGNGHTTAALVVPRALATVNWAGGGGSPGTLSANAFVTGEDARARAHGAGSLGAGVAIGSLGADRWEIQARSDPRAVATSTGGATNLAQARSTAGAADGRGQAYANTGAGVLLEPGGADLYLQAGSSSPTAVQNGAAGTTSPGPVQWAGRARTDVAGVSALLDAEGKDTYGATPSGAAGAEGRCWSNSPPSLPGTVDAAIAVGIDVLGTSVVTDPSCTFPFPPN